MSLLETIFGEPKYDYPSSRFEHHVKKTVKNIQKLHWRYQNVVYIAASLGLAYVILISGIVNYIGDLGSIGYASSFIFGLMVAYGATTAPAAVSLFMLGKEFNPVFVALLAAVGATITDAILFRFIKSQWTPHIENVLKFFKIRWRIIILKVEKSKLFQVLIPVAAGLVIASPLPNELAVFLLGTVKYDTKHFMMLAYVFHFIGILAIVMLGNVT